MQLSNRDGINLATHVSWKIARARGEHKALGALPATAVPVLQLPAIPYRRVVLPSRTELRTVGIGGMSARNLVQMSCSIALAHAYHIKRWKTSYVAHTAISPFFRARPCEKRVHRNLVPYSRPVRNITKYPSTPLCLGSVSVTRSGRSQSQRHLCCRDVDGAGHPQDS